MRYLVLINFKTYEKGTGRKGLKLARAISGFKSEYQLVVVSQLVDLRGVCKAIKIPVFAQHVDRVGFGAGTGSVLPEAVKGAGAKGTLLNHSEKRISLKEIKETVEICRKIGLVSVVCASSLKMVKKITKFGPDYIAYEPKRLIGKNISVTDVSPKVVLRAVRFVKKVNPKVKVLCGAGIHSKKDVLKALELGAGGVLIAHKVVKAKDPKKALRKLLG